MKLAFALLAHGDPEMVENLVRLLISEGHFVAVHYDAKSAQSAFDRLTAAFKDEDHVRFARREKVGWGQWGVVQGALNCLDEIEDANWNPTYVYHLSGMDYPIRSSAQLMTFLKRNSGDEFIESVPSDTVRWVKTGPQRERYQYRWLFNWRSHPQLTDFSLKIQQVLGLKRPFVRGIVPYMGSQWWVLTWKTLKKIRAFARDREIIDFFKTTLVPDELFFQTLVRHVAPEAHVTNCSLTLYQFTDYGLPVVYYSDHVDYLVGQQFFMARKISPNDLVLREKLNAYWRGLKSSPPVSDRGVGIVGPEYETRRVAYRDGAPGLPLIGAPRTDWRGDLFRLGAQFLVIVGTSTPELNLVQGLLAEHRELLCHGQVLDPKVIDFAGQSESFAGYSRNDIQIRDVDPSTFIHDVLRSESKRTTVFSLNLRLGEGIPDYILAFPGLRLVIVRGNPLATFLEYDPEMKAASRATPAIDTLQIFSSTELMERFEEFANEFDDHVATLEAQGGDGGLHLSTPRRITLDLNTEPQMWKSALDGFIADCGISNDDIPGTNRTSAPKRIEKIRSSVNQ